MSVYRTAMAIARFGLVAAFAAALALVVSAQSRPPKPPPPDRDMAIADIRRKLNTMKPVDGTAGRALAYARTFLTRADGLQRSGDLFAADRTTEAADALVHVAEHQQHLHQGGGPQAPPPPPDHLQRVYFRVQQADYFLKQARDPSVKAFPKWARDFYELAVRAAERRDRLGTDENAHSAEEVVRALESLAQAASPEPGEPEPPPPPAPPPPLPGPKEEL